MANVQTVEEVLATMQAKEGASGKMIPNRFNKRNFTALMTAMANDPEFTTKVAKTRKGELESLEDIMVSKDFRKFCRTVAEKCGVDKTESARVLTNEITFSQSDLSGLYEFFATAVYEYMAAGNHFEFLPKEDFTGSIALKDVPETTKVSESFYPKDKERVSLGMYETTKKAHKELTAKSGCPKFLKHRRKV
jgi:hypothetical protein